MALFIRNPTNPNVNYAGKTLPKDKASPRVITPDPNVNYNGSTLPADKVAFEPFVDRYNTPSEISLISPVTTIILPPDTLISIHAEKTLVMTQILDGVSVFEHIMRKPYHIELSGTLRMQNKGGITYENTSPPAGVPGVVNNVFAQQYLNSVWTNAWLPDTVLKISNSYLNGLGIQEIIIEGMTPSLVRGSTNIPFHISAWENVPGQSLIIA